MIAIGLELPAGTFREAGRYAFVYLISVFMAVSDIVLTGHTY